MDDKKKVEDISIKNYSEYKQKQFSFNILNL